MFVLYEQMALVESGKKPELNLCDGFLHPGSLDYWVFGFFFKPFTWC